ncbi:prostaglandin reductase 1 [Asbolus verrucosus]|uniref:Prostaglandin reductase 1 n=1 Tax=Asbolus verrucosus TaxID=1661398 RepID=A0A482V1Q1_ASBVE|nr:prostaglandin reductase 1 [Asbolus verrucosus]
MVKARKYVFQKQFEGLPKETDLKLVEEELPPIKDGEFLAEAVFLSVDPYMRAYAPQLPLGSTFIGSQVAKVIESKNSSFPVGQYIVGNSFGWRTHTISDGKPTQAGQLTAWLIPDPEGLPLSYSLGVLGMPGNTAYFGFLEICRPKSGETVVVTGAAGAVGSIVGQIAKIKGCTVIGIAGSEEKGKWLVDELKFDRFINYKDKDFEKKLKAATPKGVDCYFDNVGGEISTQIINRMNKFGRISVCGSISGYNDKEKARGMRFWWHPVQNYYFFTFLAGAVQFAVVSQQLKMEGFIVHRWLDRWFEGIKQNKQWIKEGKLKYRESVTEGFDNMFKAFVDMLQGGNTGKAIVKV